MIIVCFFSIPLKDFMAKTRLIIWDFNGSLVDDAWLFTKIINTMLSNHGLKKISINDYRNVFCFPIEKYYRRLGFNFAITPFDSLSNEFITYYNKHKYQANLFSGAFRLLKKIQSRKIDMCLLSAQNHSSLIELSKYYGIHSVFKVVQGTDNINAKGKSGLAKKIISLFDYKSDEVLFIGDTNMDVDLASENSTKILALTCGHQSSHRFPMLPFILKVDSFDQIEA